MITIFNYFTQIKLIYSQCLTEFIYLLNLLKIKGKEKGLRNWERKTNYKSPKQRWEKKFTY